MTDPDLVAKRLALIETCLREMRALGRPERVADNVRERRFLEHTLQIAIQAALDVASHVVSSERLGEPKTNHELFTLLERRNWIATELGTELRKMAGFRNVLVHGYIDVDAGIVSDVVLHRLGDLEAFVAAIRTRMAKG